MNALEHTQQDDCPACIAIRALAGQIVDVCNTQTNLDMMDRLFAVVDALAIGFAETVEPENAAQYAAMIVKLFGQRSAEALTARGKMPGAIEGGLRAVRELLQRDAAASDSSDPLDATAAKLARLIPVNKIPA